MKHKRKVALLGMAPGWDRAPWADRSWEIWALNNHYKIIEPDRLKRITRWFELHANTALTRSRRPPSHWRNLQALKIPVYSFYRLPTITRQKRYPIRTIEKRFGVSYFGCTFAYQIALALHEGISRLALYGTPLCESREALVERPTVEWWLGFAQGRGVEVSVDHNEAEGTFRHDGRYALDDQQERLAAYLYTLRFQRETTSWLIDETKRLQLATVGVDGA